MRKENDIILKEKNIDKYNISTTIEGIDIIHKQMMKSVCKIMKAEESGTGFFCKLKINNKYGEKKFMNTLITNNHVIGENDLNEGKEIFISWNDQKKDASLNLDKPRIKFTNGDLDVTIIELKEDDKIKDNEFLEIDPLLQKEKKL